MERIKLFYIATLVFLLTLVAGCIKAPEPSIKEGRFNFSVTYEVDGEVETISSVFVCKFVEAGRLLDGFYVKWDSYIEDPEIEELFPEYHYNCIIVEINEDGTIYLDLNLFEDYFMSEPGYKDLRDCTPKLFMEYHDDKAEEFDSYGTEDPAVIESYGVKIISYEYDAPIENVYK